LVAKPSRPDRGTVNKKDESMKVRMCVGAVLAMLAMPAVAQAQGVPGGAAHGFHEGARIAGPVGAVVGTAVGGVIGGVEGVLGVTPGYVAQPYGETARPRHYRQRKAWRGKRKQARRAGYVTR
jgi:hypothetical protein